MKQPYQALEPYLEQAMAYQTAQVLFEWDNETLAPKNAAPYTATMQGALSAAYQKFMTDECVKKLLEQCEKETNLTLKEQAIVREAREEVDLLASIPPEEYRAFKELVASSTGVWAKARKEQDYSIFAETLKKIIVFQKKFASYRAKDGQHLYDVMLDSYEKGFTMEKLDAFFEYLKKELVPLLRKVRNSTKEIDDSFLVGDFSAEKQEELAIFLAEYVGFDFKTGVFAVSEHPFTTNLHNHDVRITTHYSNRLTSSLFSAIHEAGHGIYEQGVADDFTLTMIGHGASMGMHESQSRFYENVMGRNEAFWVPLYGRLQKLFPTELGNVKLERFVEAINKVTPGLIRTEADELSYSLHVLVRYELEKMMIEGDLNVDELPALWADKYEEYLGIRPSHVSEGVLQDIHWSQGSFGYFPSYALGSAFAAQMYAHMKQELNFEQQLRQGDLSAILNYLQEHIHRFGKLKTSEQLLADMTKEPFDPRYYVDYLKEKYTKLYQL